MISVDGFGWCQLGNQLFQWAMLRAVSLCNRFEFRLPQPEGRPKGKGRNELTCFQLDYGHLQPTDRRQFLQRYSERSFAYDPGVFQQPDWTIYEGFFQSEKYFIDVAAEIRRELRFVPAIEAAAEQYVQRLRRQFPQCSLVALHVRRGDYLTIAATGHTRLMSPEYFSAAVERLPPGDRLHVVFSDDLRWCRKNLRRRDWKIVYCQTESYQHDLAVMSRCDHFVISPSSFSWWGAWMGSHPEKIVVAPQPWFGPKNTLDCRDVVPPQWIRLAA